MSFKVISVSGMNIPPAEKAQAELDALGDGYSVVSSQTVVTVTDVVKVGSSSSMPAGTPMQVLYVMTIILEKI